MLALFFCQLLFAISAFMVLRIQRIRDYMVSVGALSLKITVKSADGLFGYMLACAVGFIVLNAGFFFGLFLRWIGAPNFGKFVITGTFVITAFAIGILTLALAGITAAVSNAVVRAREVLDSAGKSLKDSGVKFKQLMEELKSQFPEQKERLEKVETATGGWLASLFDTTGIRAIAAIPHTIVFDTVKGVADGVDKIIKGVAAILIWIGIAGFVALILPESAAALLIIIIAYGLLMLLAITLYAGKEFVEKHELEDMWWQAYRLIRFSVKTAVFLVVSTSIYVTVWPLVYGSFPDWINGYRNSFIVWQEQSAKERFGQDMIDQRIWRTTSACDGYIDQRNWPWGSRMVRVDMPFNLLLWDAGTEKQTLADGRNYKLYMVESGSRRMTPDPDHKVWIPVSKVTWAGDVAQKKINLPKNTIFFPDDHGQPWNQSYRLTYDSVAEVTGITAFADGQEVKFARIYDRDKTYEVWVAR